MTYSIIREREFGNYFPTRETSDPWAIEQGLTHEILFLNGLWDQPDSVTRFARILKTVAYVAIDEDEDGQPVLDKWRITH